ncbi:YcsE-related riboflavin metabolism phosphatase [Mycoplasma procyoni]|uniref:YcsE-related riboflavin metabolism phosphatase n=1 Tax=Mycoplasma procyoni TaxID=568784 RepID=UPI00197BB479|nr:HAD family hydrolase [Mycoplasma procyoni]MBN3535132.1 HAD family phosphatase [Mycoplasma procyoni]
MKNKYKLVSFDLDGTILPYTQKTFGPEVLWMLKRLKEENKYVVFCTGREMITIGSLLDEAPVDYFLGANGAFIYDVKNKKMLFEDLISHNDFQILSDYLKERKCDHSVMSEEYGFFSDGHDFDNWFLRDHTHKFKNLSELNWDKDSLHIITVKTSNPQIIVDVEKFMKEKNLNLEINSTWSKGFFIANKNSNKAEGLRQLGKIINVDLSEMIAFGDSSNDFEMIKEVGYGVAMGDADDFVKEVAKDIALTAPENGAVEKLKELGII